MTTASRRSLALAVVAGALAAGADALAAPPPRVWLGTFAPATGALTARCTDCAKRTIAPVAGSVRVLTSGEGTPPPEGDVVIVSPLLGAVARGRVEQGRVAVPWFNYDLRDSDDGVLVIAGDVRVGLPAPDPADVRAIEQVLLRDDALSGVRRSLAGLEIGVVDVDGDGRADLAVTYGCDTWADGQCQSKGQFFLARHGARWTEIH